MYVSLEPHAHQGVAPPCTDAIIAAGIKRLVCPIEDPNPLVSGNGFRQLRAAGIEVAVEGSEEDRRAASELIEGFAKWVVTRRPFVTAKFAMSLDGKIATHTGDSRWIASEEARRVAHEMRAMSDAVVAGVGTVLADDPRLTARDAQGNPTGRPRLRVVVDTGAKMPKNSALLKEPGAVLWAVSTGAKPEFSARGLEVVRLPADSVGLDLEALVARLGELDCCSVLVEGGAKLLGSLFDRGLVDKVAVFVAPVVIGGERAPSAVAGSGVAKMADALRLERVRYRQVGADMLVTGFVKRGGN
jgi:diaminohydroxyphosphoribosylaminopyrimidine deaminase/5-amino-6-(5-phosphoribosylamino)uracil reductase